MASRHRQPVWPGLSLWILALTPVAAQSSDEALLTHFRALGKLPADDWQASLRTTIPAALPSGNGGSIDTTSTGRSDTGSCEVPFTLYTGNASDVPTSSLFGEANGLLQALEGARGESKCSTEIDMADSETRTGGLIKIFDGVAEAADLIHLYGVPGGLITSLASTVCVLLNQTREVAAIAGQMNRLQRNALRELSQLTSDAPTTWAGTAEFFGDR